MKNYEHDIIELNEMLEKLSEQTYERLTDELFYPIIDDRQLTSLVEDINGGDNFADYCKYIFDLLEEDGYWD